jgi:hypothetical protein
MNPTRFTISNCAPPFVNLRRLREMVIFRPKCASTPPAGGSTASAHPCPAAGTSASISSSVISRRSRLRTSSILADAWKVTSALGQNRKGSRRVHHVRSTPSKRTWASTRIYEYTPLAGSDVKRYDAKKRVTVLGFYRFTVQVRSSNQLLYRRSRRGSRQ